MSQGLALLQLYSRPLQVERGHDVYVRDRVCKTSPVGVTVFR